MAWGMKPMERCTTGRITSYAYTSDGACSYGVGQLPPYTTMAALNEDFYNTAQVCGTCFEIVGPNGAMRVMAIDLCPKAGNEEHCSGDLTHFDLTNTATFERVADSSLGVTNITYRMVSCDVTGNIKYRVKGDSSETWLSMLFFNHRTQLVSVEARQSGQTTWVPVTRKSYNEFVIEDVGTIVFPLQLRITSITGASIEFTHQSVQAGQTIDVGSQFPEVEDGYGSSGGCCAAADDWSVLFDDAVRGSWSLWSAATTSISSNSPHRGTKCLYAPLVAWGLSQLGSNKGAPTSSVGSVRFWARSVSTFNGYLEVDIGGTIRHQITAIPTAWTRYDLPLSMFGTVPNRIGHLMLQVSAANSLYFDDIVLVSNGTDLGVCADGVDGASNEAAESSNNNHGGSGGGGKGDDDSGDTCTSNSNKTSIFVSALLVFFVSAMM